MDDTLLNLCFWINSLDSVSYTHLKYGWQAVFNTFGALAIATERYGLKGEVGLRVIQNVFGVVFALIFCFMFYWLMSKKKETVVTVAAK